MRGGDNYQYDKLVARCVNDGFGTALETYNVRLYDLILFFYSLHLDTIDDKIVKFLNG
jgi:hypothetical protein